MLWLKDFFKSHMQQVVDEEDILDKDDIVEDNIMDEEDIVNKEDVAKKDNSAKSGCLHTDFREALARHKQDFESPSNKVLFCKDLCHALYSTCSVFQGCTGDVHLDPGNAPPSILLNFGYCRILLPDYHAAVDLQPGNMFFLCTRTVFHYTVRHPNCPLPDTDRQAVTCFFLEHMHRQEPLNVHAVPWESLCMLKRIAHKHSNKSQKKPTSTAKMKLKPKKRTSTAKMEPKRLPPPPLCCANCGTNILHSLDGLVLEVMLQEAMMMEAHLLWAPYLWLWTRCWQKLPCIADSSNGSDQLLS